MEKRLGKRKPELFKSLYQSKFSLFQGNRIYRFTSFSTWQQSQLYYKPISDSAVASRYNKVYPNQTPLRGLNEDLVREYKAIFQYAVRNSEIVLKLFI